MKFVFYIEQLVVMSLMVVGFNRLLWRPLYRFAETRYGE